MGKVKKKKSGIVRAAVSAVSPRAGKALELASKIRGVGGKVAGRGKAAASTGRRRSRGINLNKYAKKLLKSRLDAKLMKEKFKVINLIK